MILRCCSFILKWTFCVCLWKFLKILHLNNYHDCKTMKCWGHLIETLSLSTHKAQRDKNTWKTNTFSLYNKRYCELKLEWYNQFELVEHLLRSDLADVRLSQIYWKLLNLELANNTYLLHTFFCSLKWKELVGPFYWSYKED